MLGGSVFQEPAECLRRQILARSPLRRTALNPGFRCAFTICLSDFGVRQRMSLHILASAVDARDISPYLPHVPIKALRTLVSSATPLEQRRPAAGDLGDATVATTLDAEWHGLWRRTDVSRPSCHHLPSFGVWPASIFLFGSVSLRISYS